MRDHGPLSFLFKAQRLRECLAPSSGKGRLPPYISTALHRASRILRRYYAALAAEIERLTGLAWDLVSGEAQRRLLAQVAEMKRERAELKRQYKELESLTLRARRVGALP